MAWASMLAAFVLLVLAGDASAARNQVKEVPEEKSGKMAAVEKVTALLEKLVQRVQQEGEEEAASYNKFACFCKDTMADKNEAVSKGEDEKNTLGARIVKLGAARDDLDQTVKEVTSAIGELEQEMQQAQAERAKAGKLYTANEADLSGALSALEGAINVLKSSKPSFAQLQAVANTAQRAALIAEALGIAAAPAQRVSALFLQEEPEVHMENYKFHSNDIIETLEKLMTDFRAEKNTLDADEVSARHEHDTFMQEKTDETKRKNLELEDARKSKAQTQSEIAAASESLSSTAAILLDDQEYLMGLAAMCSDKAKTWDQRSSARAAELNALTEAIGIIQDTVKETTSSATIRFTQRGADVRLASVVARNEDDMEAVEADAEASEVAPALFLQRSSKSAGPAGDRGQSLVVALLRGRGQDLKSSLLTSLASQIAGDPLAKVKVLIQELIERLLTEAGNQATQKGWCDKALSDAEQKRSRAAESVRELNGNMAQLEATRDKLVQELAELAAQLQELEEKKAEAEKMRAEEKNENAETVQEAEDGLEAVNEAIDVISKFYKTQAKNTVDLALAQGVNTPAEDAPDAGFAAGEAYKGAQGAAGGVLGMLDVIKSDFERTVSETQAAEQQAEQDHLEFLTNTGKSHAEKTEASLQRTKEKDEAVEKLSADQDGLTAQVSLLHSSIAELLELQPVCVNSGMSYEDRVANRDDEIAALKKASCILENYAQYGPDGVAGEC